MLRMLENKQLRGGGAAPCSSADAHRTKTVGVASTVVGRQDQTIITGGEMQAEGGDAEYQAARINSRGLGEEGDCCTLVAAAAAKRGGEGVGQKLNL